MIAYRQFQRGDYLLAGIFLFVGIALTVFRIRQVQSRGHVVAASANQNSNPQDPIGK